MSSTTIGAPGDWPDAIKACVTELTRTSWSPSSTPCRPRAGCCWAWTGWVMLLTGASIGETIALPCGPAVEPGPEAGVSLQHPQSPARPGLWSFSVLLIYNSWVLWRPLNGHPGVLDGYLSELAAPDQPHHLLFRAGDLLTALVGLAPAGPTGGDAPDGPGASPIVVVDALPEPARSQR